MIATTNPLGRLLSQAGMNLPMVRVCAQCEQEFGPQSIPADHIKSHALCKRHAVQMATTFLETTRSAPNENFSPDLAEQLKR